MALDPSALAHLYRRANAARWDLTPGAFAEAVEASLARLCANRQPTAREIGDYLDALHASDLALACACANGHEGAWDHFVRELRPVLYRSADVIDPTGAARELADSLYADLYGLPGAEGERRSLFRYFHGRSSLATWLRTVLAQRHIDLLRARRRSEPLMPDEGNDEAGRVLAAAVAEDDPDRARLVALVHGALRGAVDRLPPKDRLRLRSYYLMELTLAQIGRITGEHEATVSRHLARTRRAVREEAARQLRDGGLSPAEIERGFELAVEDPGDLALHEVFSHGERKNAPPDRST